MYCPLSSPVPAHIEQDCNAYDAEKSGAGIISSDFNLQQLLEFAKDYHPNRDFVYWVRGAEYTLLNLLESDSSNYQQVLFNEMYLVEEFIWVSYKKSSHGCVRQKEMKVE